MTQFAALDNQKLNRFHIKAVILSGIGFFTDAYDIFIINIAIPMIAFIWFFQENKSLAKTDHMPTGTKAFLKASTQIGTLIGQLLFGYLSDKLGRKSMFGVVLAIMIGATLNTALAGDTKGVFGIGFMLIFWRLILGIGIGGDYPISAVITSEFATVNRRGMMVAMVFAMQGLGVLVGSLCGIIVLVAMKDQLVAPDAKSVYVPNVDNVWRLLFFLGIIPACIAMYWRLGLPETPRYNVIKGNGDVAMQDMAKIVGSEDGSQAKLTSNDNIAVETKSPVAAAAPVPVGPQPTFRQVFGNWKNGKVLLGTAMCWFLLDIGFYGVQLNQSDIIKFMGYGDGATAYDYFYNLAIGNLIVSLCGTVPGYWFSVFLIERMGRIKIQLMGFGILSIIFIVLTACFHSLAGTTGMVALFTAANFFFNFGPNTTTFILPAEIFPTRFRSTCHGISAAAGKLGAIIAGFGFDVLRGKNNEHIQIVLGIFSVCMIAGFFFTFLIPETKGRTLEELEEEFDIPTAIPA
ncbi:hypothetical protein RI367_008149 [Sorochytrium milnesiophthora]